VICGSAGVKRIASSASKLVEMVTITAAAVNSPRLVLMRMRRPL
jgi:hypothetical protein